MVILLDVIDVKFGGVVCGMHSYLSGRDELLSLPLGGDRSTGDEEKFIMMISFLFRALGAEENIIYLVFRRTLDRFHDESGRDSLLQSGFDRNLQGGSAARTRAASPFKNYFDCIAFYVVEFDIAAIGN